jgi:hypothetical protein
MAWQGREEAVGAPEYKKVSPLQPLWGLITSVEQLPCPVLEDRLGGLCLNRPHLSRIG